MVSRARNLGGLMGTSSTLDITDIANLGDLTGVDSYADSDALALAVVPIGTQAYQIDTGSFKIYRGASGWAQMDEFPTAPSWVFQGSVSGYTSGTGLEPARIGIDKFPFASDGNATTVGDLTHSTRQSAGQSSAENGYTAGGFVYNTIHKFSFTSDGNATDIGDLTQARFGSSGQSSAASGYASGGATPSNSNVIDKFPFASDGNATDVGDLTIARARVGGQSSDVSGYISGGQSPAKSDVIDKFPFATDANATDVGDLIIELTNQPTGQSSSENGYMSGGEGPPAVGGVVNIIQKFPFASDGNASDIGDLTLSNQNASGQSSTVSGYTSGGRDASEVQNNIIQKFPFASDANATDVGDLTETAAEVSGNQV